MKNDHLTFPILSDPDHAVHDQWGTYGEKLLYGKTVIGAIRSTFVLDENGVITHTFYNTKATGHVAMLQEAARPDRLADVSDRSRRDALTTGSKQQHERDDRDDDERPPDRRRG